MGTVPEEFMQSHTDKGDKETNMALKNSKKATKKAPNSSKMSEEECAGMKHTPKMDKETNQAK